eukprot:comp21722_c0_seq2/m.30711 comp21722_c0_seq2/g.30711  ORF comp21722_c0_seq2/g.30711 comp21722_c0_seq2/m.30711 type:complete len:636 (-) comp21722_c0_seq2:382-2289(-)
MSEAGFLQYEKENNRLLNALRHRREFADILDYVRDKKATILAPQDVSLGGIHINRSFIYTHVVIHAPDQSNRFVSVNGLRGKFTNAKREVIHVVAGPLDEDDGALFQFFEDPNSMFRNEEAFTKGAVDKPLNVYVLRQSEIQISDVKAPFLSISRPLTFPDCPWASQVDEQLLADTHTPSHNSEDELTASVQLESNALGPPDISFDLVPNQEQPPAPTDDQSKSTTPPADGDVVMQNNISAADLNQIPATPKVVAGEFVLKPPLVTPTSGEGSEKPSAETEDAPKNPPDLVAAAKAKSNTVKRTGSSMSEFRTKLKDPASQPLSKLIRTFLDGIIERRVSLQELPEKYQLFLETMEAKFQGHPDWRNDVDDAIEALEKHLCTKALQFVTAEHLEIKIPTVVLNVSADMAGAQLRDMNKYKVPRFKLICMVNSCKIILNHLQQYSTKDAPATADDLLPVMIYVILKTNPPNLQSHLSFIERYRNRHRFGSEQAYYDTTVRSAVAFVENMTEKHLKIDPAEYERELSAAESRLGMSLRPKPPEPDVPSPPTPRGRRESTDDPLDYGSSQAYFDPTILSQYLGSIATNYERPIPKFRTATVEDLDMNDIPVLLRDYKRLADLTDQLVEVVQMIQHSLA